MKISLFEKIIYRLIPNIFLRKLLPRFRKFRFFKETRGTQAAISFDVWYNQKVRAHCFSAYWPVHPTSTVINPKNIYCGIETSPGICPGNYIQAIGEIYVGDYTQIAPNVGIISANHALEDNRKHIKSKVHIGKYCWIGMGALIMPNVELGTYTIVGAGSVVTKSFPKGYCVIAGNPARVIKELKPEECILHKSVNEYNGYIPHAEFESYREKHLNV